MASFSIRREDPCPVCGQPKTGVILGSRTEDGVVDIYKPCGCVVSPSWLCSGEKQDQDDDDDKGTETDVHAPSVPENRR